MSKIKENVEIPRHTRSTHSTDTFFEHEDLLGKRPKSTARSNSNQDQAPARRRLTDEWDSL